MSRTHFARCAVAFLWFLGFVTPKAHGQSDYSRSEISLQAGTIHFYNASGISYFLGVGGRYDFNLNRRLAFETQVEFFPSDIRPIYQYRGGKTVHIVSGVRAKAYQSKRYAVFGLIRPGLLVFSDVPQFSAGATGVKHGAQGDFAPNLGGGVEFYPTPRLITRFELSGNPIRVANTKESIVECPPCHQVIVLSPGSVPDTWRFSFGVGYRLGRLRENEAETPVSGKLEIGPQFSTLILQRLTPDGVRTEPGVGGFASYRFFQYMDADASLTFFPRGTTYSGVQDGGQILQGFFGVKGGIRRNHLGIFGKVRPGFQSYTRTLVGVRPAPGSPSNVLPLYGSTAGFGLDLGGVVEVYLSKRALLRFDAGDSHPYDPSGTINVPGHPPSVLRGGTLRHAIQFSVGYGWRF